MSLSEIKDQYKMHDEFTPEFSLNGIICYGRLINIIDGDTIVAVLPFKNDFFKFHIRMDGIKK